MDARIISAALTSNRAGKRDQEMHQTKKGKERKAVVRATSLPVPEAHFGHAKVRYGGLAKNDRRVALPLGFTNLLVIGRHRTA